jgi:dTDP-4-amino-4,6-dideoxygalactose transaminase
MELAYMAMGLAPGDEVVTPAFTFPGTATAFLRQGARPRFCDVDEHTLNVTARTIAPRITPRTRAVVVVHYAGLPCAMAPILALARRHGLWVLEDAAHAVGSASIGGGDFVCFSFHQTKNLVCGEGGALVFRDRRWVRRVERCYEKGTDRSRFVRGEIRKYQWVSPGASFGMSDLLAGVLEAQLEKLPWITERRRLIASRYREALSRSDGPWVLPPSDERNESNWHIFAVRVPAARRAACVAWMRARGVEACSHFEPLHASPFARTVLGFRGRLPVTERVAREVIRLPIHPALTDRQVDRVARVFADFWKSDRRPSRRIG